MKVALIRQPAGLGDILWLQPIVDHISSRGFEVVYPVIDHYYESVTKNIKTNNSIFIRQSELTGDLLNVYMQTKEIQTDNFEYYPFDCITDPTTDSFRPEFSGIPVMKIKTEYYKSLNSSYDDTVDWRTSVKIIRDLDRERKYEFEVGLEEGDDFVWVNRAFGTPPGVIYRDVDIQDKSIKVIENDSILKNVFDACGVLEKAKEIHTVDTCFSYIVELLNTKADLNLYARKKPTDEVKNMDEAFVGTGYSCYQKQWKKHL